MENFTYNKIYLDSETIAEQLRSTRQSLGLKLGEVSKRLNIGLKHLEALEKNHFHKLPEGVYGRNFLKEYALFLGLDAVEMVKIFEKEVLPKNEDKGDIFSVQKVKNPRFVILTKALYGLTISFAVIVCFLFLGDRVGKLMAPPTLEIANPSADLILREKNINVIGRTESESQIVINGEQVLSDTKGVFSKKVDLKNGLNTITVTVRKKFGRENTISRQVLVREDGVQL